LLWLTTLIYYPFVSFWFIASPDASIDSRALQLFSPLFVLGFFLDLFGMVWMMCQAMRFEVRSFRYCVATQFPLAFVWYYVERVMARKGAQRLPVSTRFLCRRRKLDEHNFERHSLASQLIYPF